MRILIGVHHFPPHHTAGAEWQAFRTAQGLRARGHQVSVLTIDRADQGPPGGLEVSSDIYEGLAVRRLSFNRAHAPDEKLWEYRNPLIGDDVRAFLARERPDLFHVFSGYLLTGSAFEAAEAADVPTVVSLTDFWWLCPRITLLRTDGTLTELPIEAWRCAQCIAEERRRYRLLGRYVPGVMRQYWRSNSAAIDRIESRRAYLRERLNRVSRIISLSKFLNDIHVNAGAPQDRMVLCRQGIELIDNGVAALPSKASSDRLRVAYLGQIAELKGVHLLVEAARQIRDPRLQVRIYGDGTRFPHYSARLQQLIGDDRRITLMGPYSGPAELAQVMADQDIIVVPSIWYENSPNVILEAFALGTPCIVSDFGGMAELVEPEVSGLRFQKGDPSALAHQIERLLTEPGLLARLTAGVPTVKSVKTEMQELEQIYLEVTKPRVASL